jgi:hypothetical protein
MTGKRLAVVAAGVALLTVGAWFGVRSAGLLWKRFSRSEVEASRPRTGLPAPGSRWTVQEREAIERAVRAGYRPARPEDAGATPERDDLAVLYGKYDPFFVRGDLNGDGRPDFVQVFVREREGSVLFDVAVFFGLEGGGFSAPVLVDGGVALAAGDVAIDRTLVIVTPDLALDESYRYRFDPESRKFVDVDAASGAADDDAPEETPDQRLRIRV